MADLPKWVDLIGKPFEYGGRGPDKFDCYGLLIELHRRQGIVIPDYVSPRNDEEVASILSVEKRRWTPCEMEPGASVVIRVGRHVSHVGFMLENERMIHVWQHSGGVTVERLYDWQRRIVGFYKFEQ